VKQGIFLVVVMVNAVALFCVFNPWFEDWVTQGIVLFVLEAAFLLLIGVPVFIHYVRKGLPPRVALAASLDSVMNFLAGWV
jgi:hypothetical protein